MGRAYYAVGCAITSRTIAKSSQPSFFFTGNHNTNAQQSQIQTHKGSAPIRHCFANFYVLFASGPGGNAAGRSRTQRNPIPSVILVLWGQCFTGKLVCSQPFPAQSFAVTGNIDLSVIQESLQLGTGKPAVERDMVYLKTAGLLTDAEDEGFFLSDASGVLLDGYFETLTVDPCATSVGPGWCISPSWTGASHGTWDGRTLTWNGVISRPVPFIKFSGPSFNSFSYTIVATTIPEPGTLSLLFFLLPVVFYVGVTRGGHKNRERRGPGNAGVRPCLLPSGRINGVKTSGPDLAITHSHQGSRCVFHVAERIISTRERAPHNLMV